MTCQTLSALVSGFILLSSFLNTVFENCPKSRIQQWEQSWLKIPKMSHFDEFSKTWSSWLRSVTRVNQTKLGEKCQNSKIQMRYLGVIFKHCAWIPRELCGGRGLFSLLLGKSDLWKLAQKTWKLRRQTAGNLKFPFAYFLFYRNPKVFHLIKVLLGKEFCSTHKFFLHL